MFIAYQAADVLLGIADVLSRWEGTLYFSILDLQAEYNQFPVRKEDRHKIAFIMADGLFQFKVLPFGTRKNTRKRESFLSG